MAAGLGFKTFNTGDVLTANDVNGYLMQGVLVFASAAARNAAITSPQEGQFAFTKDTNGLWYYDGAAWVASGATGDIEGVTAGVGISGGGTSGTVTITNSMATEITAAGDVIVGTGSGTFDNLPIGTTGQVLTCDTTVSPYKVKWAAASAGGTWTQVATGSLTGTSVTVSSLAASNDFLVIAKAWTHDGGVNLAIRLRLNGDTSNNYYPVNTPTTSNNQSYLTMGPKFNTNTIYSAWQINGANTSQVKQIVMTPQTDGGGYYDSSTAISSITMFLDGGSFTAGNYYIWSR
jgi:hypothetical protein